MSRTKAEISISKDYTCTPGPRNPDEGKYSGEDFLDVVLEPSWQFSRLKKTHLHVDLDGTEGYATSFLEAAFGGLARKYGIQVVLDSIQYKSEEEPYLIDEIKSYIRDALNK